MGWFPGSPITTSARLPLVLHSVGDHFLDPMSSFLVYSINLPEHIYQWFSMKVSLVGSIFQLMSVFPSHLNYTSARNRILGCVLFSLRILKAILLCLAFSVAPRKTHAALTFNLPDFVSFWKSSEPLIYLRYSEISSFCTGKDTFSLAVLIPHWALFNKESHVFYAWEISLRYTHNVLLSTIFSVSGIYFFMLNILFLFFSSLIFFPISIIFSQHSISVSWMRHSILSLIQFSYQARHLKVTL